MLAKLEYDLQMQLFHRYLRNIVDLKHPLCILAQKINWPVFDDIFQEMYCENNGRPGIPTRVMAGLHYLKYAFNESDEGLIEKFYENPYWQYFCGLEVFQNKAPCDASTLGRWRKRIKVGGGEELLKETIRCGLENKVIKRHHVKRVIADTTVQEKAIAYPTDANLYCKMIKDLVRFAREHKIKLRQTYLRVSKKALYMQNRYLRARQLKRAKRERKRIKTYFGKPLSNFERQVQNTGFAQGKLKLAHRLYQQERHDKKKIYSLHAPEVECIAKGKAHKKYEFGCKSSYVSSAKGNFILGAMALHGNPYDGHTLQGAIDQVGNFLSASLKPKHVYVDRGYRGAKLNDDSIEIHIAGAKRRRQSASLKKWLKRRSAIEPIIGHIKNDGGTRRNHLLGREGDLMHAVLLGAGFNIRKLLRAFSWLFYRRFYLTDFWPQNELRRALTL